MNSPKIDSFKYKSFDDCTIEKDDIQIIDDSLKNPGHKKHSNTTRKLESLFSNYIGIDYTFGFFKGRHALSAILKSLELEKGDEVIMPGYTCVVVANSILSNELKPIYCDIELDTYGPDFQSIKSRVTSRTRVIITHHLYGLVCRDYSKILEYGNDNNYFIIDDCTQATGALFQNKKLGYFSTAAFYSFQHSKVISCGDGGIAATKNKAIAEKIKLIQSQSKHVNSLIVANTLRTVKKIYYLNQKKFYGQFLNYYYRLMGWRAPQNINLNEINGKMNEDIFKFSDILATLAVNQLKKIDDFNEKRVINSRIWTKWATENNLSKPLILKNTQPIFLRYPIMINTKSKKEIFQKLGNNLNIGYWFNNYLDSGAIERQPDGKFLPNASTAIKNIINLPSL